QLPLVGADRATLEASDFAAFRALADLPLAMTAHVVFSALDPVYPATTSATIIRDVIRDWIGFQGLLMSDDISMEALSGTVAERRGSGLDAGCDVVLHCNGDLVEMQAVATESGTLAAASATRAARALGALAPPDDVDVAAARAEFAAMMASVSAAWAAA